jgi:hypothetical protein
MHLHPQDKRSAHFFAGCGGNICGLLSAGWFATFMRMIDEKNTCITDFRLLTALFPLNESYDMVVDSVMPLIARAIGLAVNDYLATLSALAEPPTSLGYREIHAPWQKRHQIEEALTLVREPVDWEHWPKDAKQLALWDC